MVGGDLRDAVRHGRTTAGLLVVLGLLVALVGCGTGAPETADGAGPPCGAAVLRDWADGSIDGSYPADCYLAAIDSLPEDVRTYTSAEDDIARALQSSGGGIAGAETATGAGSGERQLSSARAESAAPSTSGSLRTPPLPVLALAGFGLLLAAAAATRLLRRSR